MALAGIFLAAEAGAQVQPLSDLTVTRPPNRADFVPDEETAKVLGRRTRRGAATECARAQPATSAPARTSGRRTRSPGPGLDFDGMGPNYRLRSKDFPFRQLADPTDRDSLIVLDTNNVVSSQGVHHAIFGQDGWPEPDPEGSYVGQGRQKANVRRVEPRNTPTMINAVFNHATSGTCGHSICSTA